MLQYMAGGDMNEINKHLNEYAKQALEELKDEGTMSKNSLGDVDHEHESNAPNSEIICTVVYIGETGRRMSPITFYYQKGTGSAEGIMRANIDEIKSQARN